MPRLCNLKIVSCLLLMIIILVIIVESTSASSSENLPESYHPYANNFEYTWPDIIRPGATQIRLHFEYLDLNANDELIILDKFGEQLASYDLYTKENFSTDWFKGDTLRVKLVTTALGTAQGFKIDDVETRTGWGLSNNLPESYHPYANNFEYTWPDIVKPGATQIRLHFEYLDLNANDELIILDKFGEQLASYDLYTKENFSTDWFKGDTLRVKLITTASGTAQGFKIDDVEIRSKGTTSSSSSSDSIDNSKSIESEAQPDYNKTSENTILTATKLTSSVNTLAVGQHVTLTAKISTPSQAEEPLGTVTFIDGTTPIGTYDVISRQATLPITSLTAGLHSITAKYNGDGNCKPSTSSTLTLTVQEQANSDEPSGPKIDKSIPNEQPSSGTSQTNKEPIWENTIISGLVVTVVGGIIVAIITNRD